ncbi:MAG: hypothetical protein JW779_04290 [Candidatus Thorarchaeota archaeon]|nr:hypothetical protein [Candidatus Thorarchaeota archaeon]
MSDWEERRRKSWGYYVCLLILIWPVFLIPVNLFLAILYLEFDYLILSFMYAILVIGLVLGFGARYRYRGINPASRNPINVGDGHYFERIGADESEYP